MGLRLAHVLDEAGLTGIDMLMMARIERARDARAFEQIALVTRTLLPAMERTGVATAAEIDVDTLAERLRREAMKVDATEVTPPFVGASARKP
jgi:hypothetical protein